MQRLIAVLALILCAIGSIAHAEIQTKEIKYQDGDVALRGYLAWDDSRSGSRPGVLVVHEWWGLNDYARERARKLAALGYVAFALDMYGDGKVTEHPQQAGEWAGQIRQNVAAWRKRAQLGLDVLCQHDSVDPAKLAAIGYCFGGATVLQLAYAGADLDGVVSFHGSLPAADPQQLKQLKARILICHGAEDGFVPEEQIQQFQQALTAGDADWQMIYYANAKHSFTNPEADQRGIDGLAYDAQADQRSWAHMRVFFDEILK